MYQGEFSSLYATLSSRWNIEQEDLQQLEQMLFLISSPIACSTCSYQQSSEQVSFPQLHGQLLPCHGKTFRGVRIVHGISSTKGSLPDGWADVLDRLCQDLEIFHWRAAMIQELRYDNGQMFFFSDFPDPTSFSFTTEEIELFSQLLKKRVQRAREETRHTCEICGKAGKQQKQFSVICVRCEEHC